MWDEAGEALAMWYYATEQYRAMQAAAQAVQAAQAVPGIVPPPADGGAPPVQQNHQNYVVNQAVEQGQGDPNEAAREAARRGVNQDEGHNLAADAYRVAQAVQAAQAAQAANQREIDLLAELGQPVPRNQQYNPDSYNQGADASEGIGLGSAVYHQRNMRP